MMRPIFLDKNIKLDDSVIKFILDILEYRKAANKMHRIIKASHIPGKPYEQGYKINVPDREVPSTQENIMSAKEAMELSNKYRNAYVENMVKSYINIINENMKKELKKYPFKNDFAYFFDIDDFSKDSDNHILKIIGSFYNILTGAGYEKIRIRHERTMKTIRILIKFSLS